MLGTHSQTDFIFPRKDGFLITDNALITLYDVKLHLNLR